VKPNVVSESKGWLSWQFINYLLY